MQVTYEKDLTGKHFRVSFSEVPEKIKILKTQLKPGEHYTLSDLGAEVWFGVNADGDCSDTMRLVFNPSSPDSIKQTWVFGRDENEQTYSFIKTSGMAENLIGIEERPAYKAIAEYFSN